jgi:hypothetical protein
VKEVVLRLRNNDRFGWVGVEMDGGALDQAVSAGARGIALASPTALAK